LREGRWVIEHAEDGARGAERLVVSGAEVIGVGNTEGSVEEREDLGAEGVAGELETSYQLGRFLERRWERLEVWVWGANVEGFFWVTLLLTLVLMLGLHGIDSRCRVTFWPSGSKDSPCI
jgi:hypothetical protein